MVIENVSVESHMKNKKNFIKFYLALANLAVLRQVYCTQQKCNANDCHLDLITLRDIYLPKFLGKIFYEFKGKS